MSLTLGSPILINLLLSIAFVKSPWIFYVDTSAHQDNFIFNIYTEYIVRNAGLDEAQAGIKIARRNTNNLRYADDTTLMEESASECESEKVGLMKVRVKKLA